MTELANVLARCLRLRPRTLVLSTATSILAVAVLLPSATFADGLTAEQILRKVSETYRNLKSFRFVQKQIMAAGTDRSLDTYPWGPIQTEIVVSKPGKVRVSNSRFVLISDGENCWTYLPGRRQYTQVAAAPLLQEKWGPSPMDNQFDSFAEDHYLLKYMNLAEERPQARLKPQMSLKIAGQEVDCYVVTLPASIRPRPLPSLPPEKLWVDKARLIVRQDELVSGLLTTMTEADLGPVPDEAFEFVPPNDARRVDSFAWQTWNQMGSYDPPGADFDLGAVGKLAPDFMLEDLDGRQVGLSGLRGKIVVLSFWASWCKPCQKEMSAVRKLHDELAPRDVVFLGVDDEDGDPARNFVRANGYAFPMLLDSKQIVHWLYAVRWVPTTVIIDRKGNLAARYVGAGGEAELRRHLKAAGLK